MLIKGERFAAHSPLTSDEKKFLRQFTGGSVEWVLNEKHLNNDQIAVREFIEARKLSDKSPSSKKLRENWSSHLGLIEHKAIKKGWWNLAGGESPKGTYGRLAPHGWPNRPPAADHESLWQRNGEILIAVYQPYPYKVIDDIDDLDTFAECYKLNFKITNFPSWWNPGRCWFIEWYSQSAPNDILNHYKPI